jgi:subtilisin family serine protease
MHELSIGLFLAVTALALAPATVAAQGTPAAVSAKLAEGSDGVYRLWSDRARLPIIVELAMPPIPDPAGFARPEDADAAHTEAIRAVQDAILVDLLGTPADLASAEASPDTNLKRMSFSPMFGMVATAEEVERLAADPRVVRIHEDGLSAPNLIQSVPLIGMPTAYAAGATGNNFRVAVLDTGGRRSHEFLSSRIVSAACYSTTSGAPNNSTSLCPGGVAESTSIDSANDCDAGTIYGCGHGTHVAGTAAGFNTNQQAGEPANGVARDARIISINVFSQFPRAACGGIPDQYTGGCVLSFTTDQMKGLERVYALRNSMNIAAVNMSLGGGSHELHCDGNPLRPIILQLRAARIATVIAAGNNGADTYINAPACISAAIAVASSTKQDLRSSFSNWGYLVDLVAPGTSILASYVSGNSNTFYSSLSGTSMAAPHVAGAFAALRTAVPDATVTQIEAALKSTGLSVSTPFRTKPRIRVAEALGALTGADETTIYAAVTPVNRATLRGERVTAFATIINSGAQTARYCSIAAPEDLPLQFWYRARNHLTGALGVEDEPVHIPAGGRQDFLMTFNPIQAMQQELALVFDCTNTPPASSVVGLNTFLLLATVSPRPADLLSVAVTASGDGIMNVPLNGTGFAALAAQNIGAPATLQARLSASPILANPTSLPGTMALCRTNPTTGACLAPPSATVDFTPQEGEMVTFTAFVTSNGTAIPFDPANTRLFVHFFQGVWPVGSASVAARTTGGGGTGAPENMSALAD